MSKSRSGAPRRVAAGLLAGALAVFGVALAPPAGAVPDATTDRVAGTTRYGTAGAIASQADFDGATSAILATGENFPDALAASGLAGSNAPAPIILTESDTLSEEAQIAMGEIESLDDVLVVGGTAAISDEVVTAVEDLGYTVNRIAGADRYETAAAIAGEVATVGQVDGLNTALIASGEVFADALAGGPLAYFNSMPVLLVNTDGVPAATEAALDEAGIEQVVLLGGTARITDETETELEGIVGNDAVRVAGVDRFETAADIGQFAEDEFLWGPTEVLLANGLNFPDALAGGPLGGERQAPIIMTASLPQPSRDYLDKVSDTLERITALGGTAAVSAEDLSAAEAAGETVANDPDAAGNSATSALNGPELQGVSIAAFDADDLEVVIAYEFDTDIEEESVDKESFKLYDADTRVFADGSGDSANLGGANVVDEDPDVDGSTVFITFSLLQQAVPTATLAAVEGEAVEDTDGNPNPPQSVEAGFDRSGTGQTNGPDLVSADVAEDDTSDDADDEFTVDYVFDSAVADDNSPDLNPNSIDDADFAVVLRNGETVFADNDAEDACTTEDDESSETVTCVFEEEDLVAAGGAGTDINDAVRAITFPGAINTLGAPGFGTPLQAAELARSGNTDDGPNLVSISVNDEDDEATFTFDEDIDSSTLLTDPVETSFFLYYSDCFTADGGTDVFGTNCAVSGDAVEDTDDRDVTIAFPEGSINEFLAGGYVLADAVGLESDVGVTRNAADEVGLSSSFESGDVAAPQLDSVTVDLDTTGLDPVFDELTFTFTFDEELDEDTAITAGAFAVWIDDEDGNTQRVDLDDCEIDDTDVVCTVDEPDDDATGAVVASVDYDAVVGDEIFALDDGDTGVQMPNPEGSFAVTVPEFEVDEDE